MTRRTYTVTVTREGSWWALVADLGHREVASQARRLDQAEPMIREAIAMVLDVDEDAFDVELVTRLDDEELDAVARAAVESRARLEVVERDARQATATAVHRLRRHGLPVRDVARLVHVTPSRVSQIEHETPPRSKETG